jgi:hypothetical protein
MEQASFADKTNDRVICALTGAVCILTHGSGGLEAPRHPLRGSHTLAPRCSDTVYAAAATAETSRSRMRLKLRIDCRCK